MTLTLHFQAVNVPGGLPIRAAPEDADNVVELVPEGSTLAPLGPAHYDGGYLWLAVRTPHGTDGWTTASGYGQTWMEVVPAEGAWLPIDPPAPTNPDPLVAADRAELRALSEDKTATKLVIRERLHAMLLALGGRWV